MKDVSLKVVGWGEDGGILEETEPGQPGKLVRLTPSTPRFYLIVELPGGKQTRAYVAAEFYRAYHEAVGKHGRG